MVTLNLSDLGEQLYSIESGFPQVASDLDEIQVSAIQRLVMSLTHNGLSVISAWLNAAEKSVTVFMPGNLSEESMLLLKLDAVVAAVRDTFLEGGWNVILQFETGDGVGSG